ncbi:MAG: hypothetical protein K5829_08940 [Treponema sp.]|nr:hypothetical protein [Treponema sp.]
MAKKQDFKNMSTKKKSQKLFMGMLMPLLTVTIVACGFFYFVSNKIIDSYIEAELKSNLEHLNSNVMDRMAPVIINVEDLANFAKDTDDIQVLDVLIDTFVIDLNYTSSLYYASTTKRAEGGFFIDSTNWTLPEGFEPSTRDWFLGAINAKDKIFYSDPYVDVQTKCLSVTISRAVSDRKGKFKGVIGCDILLDDLLTVIGQVQISPNSSMNLVTEKGIYMTNNDSEKVMNVNFFDESPVEYDRENWLNGELKAKIDNKTYAATCRIGESPWFIIIEGNVMDFKGQLSNVILIFEIFLLVFSFVASGFNIKTIANMRKGEQELGRKLYEETQTLVVAAKENAATAQDQSAAVKEIVATMEDSNALSESIASKIRDVSQVAVKTSSDVADGVSSIEQNVSQLHAIFDANKQTIDGMKELSERIESIWDIVTLINNVADQAKIIAFNAELEASSAGEAGKSFRIVANEIRRLSDGIIDGTKEIKERITEIQHSSDSLILASESGTEKINEGYENAKSLGEKFASIKNSAEVTAGSAGDITDIIQQQTTASEQILIALKQISAGVENFTVATDNISASSEHIRTMSEQMNNSVKSVEDENKEKGKKKK